MVVTRHIFHCAGISGVRRPQWGVRAHVRGLPYMRYICLYSKVFSVLKVRALESVDEAFTINVEDTREVSALTCRTIPIATIITFYYGTLGNSMPRLLIAPVASTHEVG